MAIPGVRLVCMNLFARHIERLSAYYVALFGFAEIVAHRAQVAADSLK